MEWALLPLKRYAQFSGRSRRKEYWMWVLLVVVVSVILSVLDGVLGLGGHNQIASETLQVPGAVGRSFGAQTRGGWLTALFSLAVLIPNLAVSVRRLHDVDRSGWWLLMPLVPYLLGILVFAAASAALGMVAMMFGLAAGIVLLVWFCSRGTAGPNRFGPDPLGVASDGLSRSVE